MNLRGEPTDRRGEPTRRRGERAGRRGKPVPELTVFAAFAGVGGLLLVARAWWTHSPVGYAFGDGWWFVAPTPEAGVINGLLGLGVFLAFVHVLSGRFTMGPDRLTTFIGAWLACTCAGLALGVVQSMLALFASDPAETLSNDLWPLPATLLRLSIALAYGTTIGLIAAIALILLPHTLRTPGAPITTLALTVLLTTLQPPDTAFSEGNVTRAASSAPSDLRAESTNLLARNTNLPSGNANFPTESADLPAGSASLPAGSAGLPAGNGDLSAGSGSGARTGRAEDPLPRLSVAAPAIVDVRGRQVLLRGVNVAQGDAGKEDLRLMAELGFSVVRLGVSWGRLEPNPGVTDQAYLEKVKETVKWAAEAELYTVINLRADGGLYADQEDVQPRLLATWARLATTFAASSSVAGFDLLDEPGTGAQLPAISSLLLGHYYERAITSIRTAEQAAQGFPHLIFFQPARPWTGFDPTPPPGFATDPNLVFAPHPTDQNLVSIERGVTLAHRMALRYRTALWSGTWSAKDRPALYGYTTAEDTTMTGGAYQHWKQPNCDAPASLNPVDCATGEPLPPSRELLTAATRAYPRATPGRLTSLRSAPYRRALRLTATAADGQCTLDVWAPGQTRPSVSATGVTGIAFHQTTGGWRITGCPSGDYTLELT
ncbi:glycoside hydrolase family 5 protein [Acrocarpospora catenulata]|uniref:glycoside hydrolase family 5 protein n=1 Tax=Acrocarpospora catenulata TaxID=2836182 RepID=UPI001BD9A94A|nr:cellulase family glycosylhydrolase [Acrocarpospora catenulata]